MPLVSVIIPVYNGDKFLFECLESVRTQTFTDFEVIVSDNCSTDNSRSIAQDFALRDSRFVLNFNTSNLGIFGNLNKALSLAKGKYVQLFGADDIMYPNTLERMLTVFESEPPTVGMLFALKQEFGDGIVPRTPLYHLDANFKKYIEAINFTITPKLSDYFFLSYGCLPGNISTVIMLKSVMDEVGPFCETMTYVGDFEYWIRIGRVTNIKMIPEKLYQVRVHKQRSSKTLGLITKISQEQKLWTDMVNRLTIKSEHRFAVKMVNKQVAVQYVGALFKMLVKGEFKNFISLLKILNLFPFKLHKSVYYFVLQKTGIANKGKTIADFRFKLYPN